MSRGIASPWLALVLGLSLLSLLNVAACERGGPTHAPAAAQDDPTDQLTQDLLANLRAGDLQAARAQCTATLAGDLGRRGASELEVITATLEWLGAVESLELESEHAVAGGVERRYVVRFGREQLGLSVTAVGGKLEGFVFDAAQWRDFVDQAAVAAAGSLRVAEFRYLGPKGKPITAPLDPANISYDLALEGLEALLREHHVMIAKTVRDAEGNEVYRQTEDDDVRFPQAEAGSGGGRITGSVAVPGPGRYQLELRIRDMVGAQLLTYKESFVIE
ncbi:hypothetical protein DB30_01987 [Enhygromyxa salina]|uniref:Uncharacterized protein n=1 Tax=Enhygromyxa salina TaxID=215803 RepID=A0A0C2D914_9BACT|nr:hypothetical protein [Enhygromyxa salina]KIG18100.1 hypothetical protein DB30_01987 [Enhygromyxa salina]